MKHLKEWIEAKRGRAARLAVHLDVPQSFVSKMASGAKPIPIEHMAAIEGFTAGEVTRKDMCPSGWARIWPELAIREGTHA